MDFLKRTWAEIDLAAIAGNFRLVRGQVSPRTAVMAVVKADAYGHGDAAAAAALAAVGVDWFGVQPSEVAKLAIVVWGADVLARKYKMLGDPRQLLIPFLPVSLVLIGLVVLQDDLGTGMIMGAMDVTVKSGPGTPA